MKRRPMPPSQKPELASRNPPEGQGRRLVLHAGTPKTATTTIQRILEKNIDLLKAQGYAFPTRRWRQEDPLFHYLVQFRKGPTGRRADRIRDRLDEILVREGAGGIFLSYESIFSEPVLESTPGFFPQLDEIAASLSDVLAPYNPLLVVAIRRQSELLGAFYSQSLRRGSTMIFSDYAASFLQGNPSWTSYIERLNRHFPAASTRVIHYDSYRRDVMRFFGVLNDLLVTEGFRMPEKDHRNPSLGPEWFETCRRINQLTTWLPLGRNRRRDFSRLYTGLMQYIPRHPEVRQTEPVRQLDELFEEENRQLLAASEALLAASANSA